MSFRLLAGILCASVAAVSAADKTVGGPFVVNVRTGRATVSWVLQSSDVKLGTAPGNLDRTSPVLRSQKVTYTGLKPATTYYYETPDGGRGRFKTAPQGRASFDFIVYGDTRTRHDVHRRVIEAMVRSDPDFIIHTGDLVTDGDDTGLWPVFLDIEKDMLAKTAFFPVIGNHERSNRQYFDFFDVRNPYYSFDWGAVHFAVLDTDIDTLPGTAETRAAFWTEQAKWLEADLARAQKADFRFVVMHHPPYTAVKARQGANRVQELVPTFDKYNVRAVFAGHDHNYQHHLRNGIHYIVTGGGGAPLYNVDAPLAGMTQKVETIEHYVKVRVEGNRAFVEAVALDGRVIDRIELTL